IQHGLAPTGKPGQYRLLGKVVIEQRGPWVWIHDENDAEETFQNWVGSAGLAAHWAAGTPMVGISPKVGALAEVMVGEGIGWRWAGGGGVMGGVGDKAPAGGAGAVGREGGGGAGLQVMGRGALEAAFPVVFRAPVIEYRGTRLLSSEDLVFFAGRHAEAGVLGP